MLESSWVAYFVVSHGWGEGFYISGIGERKLIAGEERGVDGFVRVDCVAFQLSMDNNCMCNMLLVFACMPLFFLVFG